MPVPHNMEAFDSFSLANVVRYRQRRSEGGTVACSAFVVNALCGLLCGLVAELVTFCMRHCWRTCSRTQRTQCSIQTALATALSLCLTLTWVLVPCRDRLVAPAHKREALNPDTGEVAVINVTNPMVECNTIRAILAEVVSYAMVVVLAAARM